MRHQGADRRAAGAFGGSRLTVRLLLATENRDKAAEIRLCLRGIPDLEVQTLLDLPGLALPPEVGTTYAENAVAKARYAARAAGCWALGDDTGLEVEALDGAPGLYSARYAGEGVTYAENRAKLLAALAGVPEEKRGARFVCAVAAAGPAGEIIVARGFCHGRILTAAAGQGGFGYDPIFFIPRFNKTFGELSSAEKNQVSHRGEAMRRIMAELTAGPWRRRSAE